MMDSKICVTTFHNYIHGISFRFNKKTFLEIFYNKTFLHRAPQHFSSQIHVYFEWCSEITE